jgi:hypothetical protein
MKPGAVLRLAVPDLETIARQYLAALDGALAGDPDAALRHDWMMLELLDQTVRSRSGGRMAAHLHSMGSGPHAAFVASRIGAEAMPAVAAGGPMPARWRLARRAGSLVERLRQSLALASARLTLGSRGSAALREGLFRQSGELHRWMYDRYSLGRLMADCGFEDVHASVAGSSRIPEFAGFGLEIVDGKERKPDSLYMEARKPDNA